MREYLEFMRQAAEFERNPMRISLLDPLLVGRAHVVYERGEHMGGALL